ncbi:MAG: XdhC family protein [Synechococcus sp.]|nr:XdhC family protein [Synechococcus sp.]
MDASPTLHPPGSVPLWQRWRVSLREGQSVALATVVEQRGSSPRPVGSTLLIGRGLPLQGSVSAGCLEADGVRLGEEVLAEGRPQEQHYGPVEGNDPLAIGLSCGGSLHLAIDPWSPADLELLAPWFAAMERQERTLLATRLDGPGKGVRTPQGHWCSPEADACAAVLERCWGRSGPGSSGLPWPGRAWIEQEPEGARFLLREHLPPPPLWIFGADDTAAALAALAQVLGYRSTVVDARPAFARPERCPAAEAMHCRWPHQWFAEQTVANDTAICVLQHDPKFEIPLLALALRSPACYVGAMGSRGTQRRRLELLRQQGLSEGELARLRAPIGLDLGGRTPAELALAILAEVAMLRGGGQGGSLSAGAGPIHPRP